MPGLQHLCSFCRHIPLAATEAPWLHATLQTIPALQRLLRGPLVCWGCWCLRKFVSAVCATESNKLPRNQIWLWRFDHVRNCGHLRYQNPTEHDRIIASNLTHLTKIDNNQSTHLFGVHLNHLLHDFLALWALAGFPVVMSEDVPVQRRSLQVICHVALKLSTPSMT